MWIISIPVATLSGNETLRMHFRERHRYKESLGWLLVSALNQLPKIPKATGQRKLIIERHGKKALDYDNLCSGAKGLIDCIREQRLILDDCPELCSMEFKQVINKKNGSHTVIYLEDIDSIVENI